MSNPSARQIGGDHYAKLAIQPMRYSMANGLNALQHTIIKYVTRYKDKGGIEDLRKAAHSVEMLIQHELDEAHKRDGWTQTATLYRAMFPPEFYTEATEARMDVVGQNGNTAEHCPSDEWIPTNGQEPDLRVGTRVDIRFADGKMETDCSASNWVWMQDGASDDITHYRIHQPE